MCNLGTTSHWKDLADLIPDHLVHRLSHIYDSPDDVDLYIGQAMETPVANSQLGPTTHCLIEKQFLALRKGDRFFYTNAGQFNSSQLADIMQQSLTSVVCANADDSTKLKLPPNLFRKAETEVNEAKPCAAYPEMNLSNWS